jgi:DNA polymerase-3 subunit epsilon
MQKAIAASGVDVEKWLGQVDVSSVSGTVRRSGDPDAPFAGEVILFTGALTMPRKEAADAAARLGFNVADSVSKKITTLCVGLQDATQLAGYDKSSKHRKVEELISDGHEIVIIGERDFMELIATHLPQR